MTVAYHPLVELIQAGGPGSGCRGPACGRPRGVKQVFQTNSGVTYTILKPSRKGISKSSHTVKEPQLEKRLKGKYKLEFQHVRGKDGRTSVYSAKWGKRDRYAGQGKVLFVDEDFKNMRKTIEEHPVDEMDHSGIARSTKFKNFGQAAGFLNKRFGIRQKLSKGD